MDQHLAKEIMVFFEDHLRGCEEPVLELQRRRRASTSVMRDELEALLRKHGIESPIPMVLICPNCNNQHVDHQDLSTGWTNPPHKSHLCHFCGCIWRPCDYATVGVGAIASRGEADTIEVNTFVAARTMTLQEAAQLRVLKPGDVVEVPIGPGRFVRFRQLAEARKECRQ